MSLMEMIRTSEAGRMNYVNQIVAENTLTYVQESPNVRAETIFETYDDCSAVRAVTKVTNITDAPIILEEVSSLCLCGMGDKNEPEAMRFTNFLQSHHAECQNRTRDFKELGLCGGRSESQQRIAGCNIGSWSTKELLPMGILEHNGNYLMFQIESNKACDGDLGIAGR